MKTINRIVLLLVLVFLSVGAYASYSTSCSSAVQKKSETISNNIRSKYYISIDYNENAHTAKASETIIYHNSQSVELNNIIVQLFPNAYRNEKAVPVIGNLKNNYPKGFNQGYITVSNVRVNEKTAKYKIDNMTMYIGLDKPLRSNDSVSVSMDFELKLPTARTRFGTYGGVSQFAYWYPVLAVYDKGWAARQYNRIGESNYSDTADYEVSINLPAEDKVAATGDILSEKAAGNQKKTVMIKADNVRDFTWVCSKDFIVSETAAEGIKIKNYYLVNNEKTGKMAGDYAAGVLKYYNGVFGKYPYKTFSVVNTYLYGGGMEFPQLVSLGQSLYETAAKLEHGVAHETAHQWWYVTVGNDEYKYPWLDEGLAVYSTELYTARNSRDNSSIEKVMDGYRKNWIKGFPVNSPVNKFDTWSQYSTVSYKMGAAALDDLRKNIGDEKFFKVMSSYYNEYKLKNADTEDFIGMISKVAGKKAAEDFRELISGKR